MRTLLNIGIGIALLAGCVAFGFGIAKVAHASRDLEGDTIGNLDLQPSKPKVQHFYIVNDSIIER